MRRIPTGAVVLGATGALVLAVLPGAGGYTLFVVALVVVQVIAVLSLGLLMGYAGQVSLGHAAFVGVGAYAAAQLVAWHVPFALVIPGAALMTAGTATIVGLPSLRIRGLHLAATTLAFGIAAERLLFARPWDETSNLGMSAVRPAVVASDLRFLGLVVAALAVVAVLDRSIRRSRVGRAFLAVRDGEDIAASRGISVARTKLLAYALSGLYAGIAGGCLAFLLERVTPGRFSVWASLGYVAMVVVGGLGSFAGAVAAGVGFTALPELLRATSTYAPLAGAVLLMVVPIIRPQGMGWLLDRPIIGRRRAPASRPEIDAGSASLQPPMRPLRLSLPVRTLLSLEDVTLSYGGLQVLRTVSLDVGRSEAVGLIGPNGAGKSTIFNCVSGFADPHGSIRYRGIELLTLPADARAGLGIARTFQQVGLCANQTVRDNVVLAQHSLARYGVLPALMRAPHVRRAERAVAVRADAALELAGIVDLADVRVADLPHGRQRLAEVAAVLASGADLLLLDEPAAGMDAAEAAELSTLLCRLRADLNFSMLVIDHHVPFVAALCDWLYVLVEGGVAAEGTAADVQADPMVAAVYLGRERAARPEPLVAHG